MYEWIWRHLPGSKWVKAVIAGVLIFLLIAFLFEWGFPWFVETFHYGENTVN